MTVAFIILVMATGILTKKTKPADVLAGYWKGTLYTGAGITIINRHNGTTTVYLLTGNANRFDNISRFDGQYAIKSGLFTGYCADAVGHSAISIETSKVTMRSMQGVIFLSVEKLGTLAYDFEVTRQYNSSHWSSN